MAPKSLVGATVASYVIEAIARQKGDAIVYRATHETRSGRVALTVLGPQSARDPELRGRLAAAAAFTHPHVVPVLETGESDGALYLVSEWLDGVDLGARLASRGPLGPDEAARLLRPVASALAAAHRAGLVHGELSSADVLIADHDAGVFLAGLGVADPAGGVDADISAFGALLLETLTARPAHEREPGAGPPVNGGLERVIAGTTASDPATRLHSADELVLALERARGGARAALLAPGRRIERAQPESDDGASEEPYTPAARSSRRITALTGAIALSVLAVVLIIALATYSATRNKTPSRTTPISPALPLATVAQGQLAIASEITLDGPAAGLSVAPSDTAWVSVPGRNELVAVAPNQPPKSFAGIPSPGPIAAAGAGVWVTNPATNSVALFADGRLGSPTALPARPVALAVDPSGDAAWIADANGGLSHVPSHTGAAAAGPEATAHVAPSPSGIAVGEPDSPWSANGSLVRTNPMTLGSDTFDTGAGTVDVTLDQGVWTGHADGTVNRFDPRPGHQRIVASVVAPGSITRIAAREQSPFVWAISGPARSLYQIDIAERRIVGLVHFSSPPTAVAVTHLGVWVTTAGGSLIRIKR